jgi:hypothetical protein
MREARKSSAPSKPYTARAEGASRPAGLSHAVESSFLRGRKSPRRIPGAKFCARRGKPKAPRRAFILRSDVGGVEREQV